MAYCTRDDVFNLALSARAFIVRAVPFEHIDASTGIIRLSASAFASSDFVTIEKTTGGTMPTGILETVKYPVAPITDSIDLFRLCDPNTLVPIASYVTGGDGWAIKLDVLRRLDLHIVAAAARIDENLTGHTPPLLPPIPMQVVEINARMAARRMITTLQFENPQFRASSEQLIATAEQDEDQLRVWLAGKPINPRPVDEDNIADNGARAGTRRAPVGWSTGCM